jgi:hypothetical protein
MTGIADPHHRRDRQLQVGHDEAYPGKQLFPRETRPSSLLDVPYSSWLPGRGKGIGRRTGSAWFVERSSGWSRNDFRRDLNQEFLASEKERPRELQMNWGRLSQKGVLPRPTKSPRFFEASSTRVGPNQAIHDLL